MEPSSPYKIFFISDSVATIDFGNVIGEQINKKAIAIFHYLSSNPLEGMIEAFPAYSSVTIYFDVPWLRRRISAEKKVCEWIAKELHRLMLVDFPETHAEKNLVRIPVCYESEFAIDLEWMAEQTGLAVEKIVRLHNSKEYRVYMLGFLPGFAYMGEVEEQIAVPRKVRPQPIFPGSVGIAGRQTGVYPLSSPGGWRIIGRTPLKMFDKERDEICLLRAGDYVQFESITRDEFENYQGWGV